MQDSPKRRLLQAIEKQPAMLVEMLRLTHSHLTCATQSRLLESLRLNMFFKYKGPAAQVKDFNKTGDSCITGALSGKNQMMDKIHTITNLRLLEGVMMREDCNRLLRYLDFSQMVNCSIQQTNVLALATLVQIANVVPRESSVLQHLYVRDGKGLDDEMGAVLEAKFRLKRPTLMARNATANSST